MGGRHNFYLRQLLEGQVLIRHQGWMGGNRYQALRSTATLSASPLPLLGRIFRYCRFLSVWRALWRSYLPWVVVLSPSSTIQLVPKVWPWEAASFAAAASSLLSQYDLVVPCHQVAVTSWGVVLVGPPPSRIAHCRSPLYDNRGMLT